MTSEGRIYAHGVEEVAAELQQEFRDEAEELVRTLDVALDEARHERMPQDALIKELHRVSLKLRAQAANVGVRLIGTVAHRMADYLANIHHLPPRGLDDIQVYLDTLIDIVEGKVPDDIDPAQLVRALPAKVGFEVEGIEVRNVEVMLVMLHGAATHFVERELQQCGYRVSTVTSTFDALPLIVRTQPDMVIISAVMPDLSGIDLVAALTAMPRTRNIATALITSLDPDDEYLQLLPKGVPVIHKGSSFGDDLAEALNARFLL